MSCWKLIIEAECKNEEKKHCDGGGKFYPESTCLRKVQCAFGGLQYLVGENCQHHGEDTWMRNF